MTEGKSLPLIISFAIPLFLGNMFQQAYNLIDAAIVGRALGANALASVGASSSVQFLVLGFCIGICCGFAIPVAQRFGADDFDGMRSYVFHGAVLTVIIGIALTIACAILCPQILHLLSTPDDIFQGAYDYLLIVFLGIPCMLLYNFLSAILRAVGDSKTPFMFLILAAFLNIVLDLFFILVLHWGCGGAAIATLIAQGTSGVLCFFYIKKRFQILHLKKSDRRWNRLTAKQTLVMGLPMGLQYSITAIGSMVMQSANNGLGSIYVSGFTAGARIKSFFLCPFDAFATATSTFASQNLGAGKFKRIYTGLRQGIMLGMGYGIIAGVVMIFLGRPLSMMFISGEEAAILDASAQYLRCMGYFLWSLGILNICRMTTQGIGFAGKAIIPGVIEMIARIFMSFVFVPKYGYDAICFSDQTAWITAAIFILPVCLSCLKKVQRAHAPEGDLVQKA